MKLVAYLQQKRPESGRQLKKWIEANCVTVNGQVENFASRKIYPGDKVVLALRKKKMPKVVLEDDHLIIADKPCDITSEELQKQFFPRAQLVNRLDRQTSGLILLAKSEAVREQFIELFKLHQVKKYYHAWVQGTLPQPKGEIRSFLKQITVAGKIQWGSASHGKEAITRYEVVEVSSGVSKVLCEAVTGRTHQLRVHLLEMGCPILGDYQYVREFRIQKDRLMLHSYRLHFSHPVTGQEIDISLPIS